MSTKLIWNIGEEKDREKERVGGREKGRQRSRARDKKQRRYFLLEEQHENFVAAVTN